MNTTASTATLKELVESLLNISSENKEGITNKINEICYLYQELSGTDGRNTAAEYITNVPTEVGVSLSLNHAASCMTDYNRTYKFLKGTIQAINDIREKNPDKTIQFFYAGCGPLAPFMTMIAPLYSPKEIQFTLLEINKKSLEVVKKLINGLELSEYVKEYYSADAITFEIPNADTYDILFSETLDSLLHRESYVPILWNMLPQLSNDITVIPNNVRIKVNYNLEGNEVPFAVAFDTRKMLEETPKTKELPELFKTNSFSMKDAENYYSIIIDTEVEIYKEYILGREESSISLAIEVPIEKPVTHEYVDFVYRMKPTPGLQFGVR